MKKIMLAAAAALMLALAGSASAQPCASVACTVVVDGEEVEGSQEVCCPATDASVTHLTEQQEICGAIVTPAGSVAGCIESDGTAAGCVLGQSSAGECAESDGALACHACGCATVGECVPN